MFLAGTTNIAPGDSVAFTLDRDDLAIAASAVDIYFAEKAVFKEIICSFREKVSSATRPQRSPPPNRKTRLLAAKGGAGGC